MSPALHSAFLTTRPPGKSVSFTFKSLFICFGSAWSSLLRGLFSSCVWGLLSSCGAQALGSTGSGVSSCGVWARWLRLLGSRPPARELWCMGLLAPWCVRSSWTRGEPMSFALAGGFWATREALLLHFWRTLLLDIGFLVERFFSPFSMNCVFPLSACLYVFWYEINWISVRIPCVQQVGAFLLLSRLSLFLSRVIIIYLVWVSLSLSYLKFFELLGFGDSCISSVGGVLAIRFSETLSAPLFLLLTLPSCRCQCPTGSSGFVHFSSFFSILVLWFVLSLCLLIPSSTCSALLMNFHFSHRIFSWFFV